MSAADGAGDPTFIIVWRFRAKPGRESEFERVYGAAGDWSLLFARGDGYLGTELHRATDGRGYLVIDRWRTRESFKAFRARWASEYEALDDACRGLTELEEEIGTYTGERALAADPSAARGQEQDHEAADKRG